MTANAADGFGKIIRLDDRLDEIIPPDAQAEKLASGFTWAEGPVWIADGRYLLFSDIPRNSVMKWKEGEGISVFLNPSGYTGHDYYGLEPGSNGLTLDKEGRLLSCEHGDRRVSVLTKGGGKRTLIDNYMGKRLNSPNDLVMKSNGDIYFTDPIYGLPNRADDPRRELDFCGVYRLSPDGTLTLLTDEMTRPNGLAFSPDESKLYVAQSDPDAAIWKEFPVHDDGTLGESKLFYDVTNDVGKKPGLPDGMKVDAKGNLFATGPGGVLIFSPDATLIGMIETGVPTANCGWGNDGSVLYITADSHLLRLQTSTKGAGW
ncbi:MAG: SMP-30/gluconolactonase/LRE family protein [Planctomycetaceae bacterium]|nr:SMP-30/gluconolactonase/LRE family protein [Planctomycetaceae bacterium]